MVGREKLDLVKEVRWNFFVLSGLVDERVKAHFEMSFRKVVGLMGKMRGLKKVALEIRVRLVEGWDVRSLLVELEREAKDVLGMKEDGRKVEVEVVAR